MAKETVIYITLKENFYMSHYSYTNLSTYTIEAAADQKFMAHHMSKTISRVFGHLAVEVLVGLSLCASTKKVVANSNFQTAKAINQRDFLLLLSGWQYFLRVKIYGSPVILLVHEP